MAYYAVRQGRNPGIYHDWPSCQLQVTGYRNAIFRKFKDLADAQAFIRGQVTEEVRLPTTTLPAYTPGAVWSPKQVIYTDGCSLGNGRYDMKGGAGIWFGPQDCRNKAITLGRCTNQQAELEATIHAVQMIPDGTDIEIRTDSQYVIKGITQWIHGWRAANFQVPVKNLDLFLALDNAIKIHNGTVNFVYVPGHSDDVGNDAADYLAKQGARQ